MAKFSRGSQLGDSQRSAGREQRLRQISERNKALRAEKTKGFVRKAIIVLVIFVLGVIVIDRQFVRYNQDAINEPYKNTVNEYFNGNLLRKSKLFYNSDDFADYIIKKHPEVQKVDTKSSFFTNTKFVFELKQPSFVWQVNNVSYLGDADGVAYALNDKNSDDIASLPILKDQAALTTNLGDKVLPASTFDYIKEIETGLSSTSLKPNYYLVPAAAREIHLFIDGQSYYIKFSLDRSVTGQVSELTKVMDFIVKSNTRVGKYIDLRTEDRAYYQ